MNRGRKKAVVSSRMLWRCLRCYRVACLEGYNHALVLLFAAHCAVVSGEEGGLLPRDATDGGIFLVSLSSHLPVLRSLWHPRTAHST